jgi:hypothetical protein
MYSHPPPPALTDVNWFHETSSINDLLVNEQNFKHLCCFFHFMAHNFSNFIQKVAICDENETNINKIAPLLYQNGWLT